MMKASRAHSLRNDPSHGDAVVVTQLPEPDPELEHAYRNQHVNYEPATFGLLA